MNIRRRGWLFLFFLSLCCGYAQQNRRIALDLVVTDKSGKPIPGLQQQDFALLDNKQPAKILSFEAIQGGAATADSPVEVILLVDEVNSSFSAVSRSREEIEKFLKRN